MYLAWQWLITSLKLVNLSDTDIPVILVNDTKYSTLKWKGGKKEEWVAFIPKKSKSHCQSLSLQIILYEEHKYMYIYK